MCSYLLPKYFFHKCTTAKSPWKLIRNFLEMKTEIHCEGKTSPLLAFDFYDIIVHRLFKTKKLGMDTPVLVFIPFFIAARTVVNKTHSTTLAFKQ